MSKTAEEFNAQNAEFARRLKAMLPAREAIIATKLNRGRVDCPLCGKLDALSFTVSSYNGHVWGRCSTKDCLAWME